MQSCRVFIYLQKALDTVDHGILLSKPNHYGVRGTSYQWFKSYLTGRQQYTTIDHLKSDLCSINYGVPQGSVLGPILFLLYINDLNQAIVHSKVHHFADETNFLYANQFIFSIHYWTVYSTSKIWQQLSLDINISTKYKFVYVRKYTHKNEKATEIMFCESNKN